jgi:hypothetical protein
MFEVFVGPRSSLTRQVCCAPVTSKYACNDWGQVMCSSHTPESSQCFDCGRYITAVCELPARQRLLRYLSSSAREAMFSDVAHPASPNDSVAPATLTDHVACIVDTGRVVDGRTQVMLHCFSHPFSASFPNFSASTAAPEPPTPLAPCAAFGPVWLKACAYVWAFHFLST